MRRLMAGAVLAVFVLPCGADMPAVDIYKVRWAPVKEAAVALGGGFASFVAEVEKGAVQDLPGGDGGVLVFRSPLGFTEPLNERIRAAVAAGRREAVGVFLRAVNDGGWIRGQLIARNGGEYTVSLEWREEGKECRVDYTHRFADGRQSLHSHVIPAVEDAKPAGGMRWIRDAREIVIEDHWAGLSPVSPIESDYTLARNDDGSFGGKAAFSVGGHFKVEKETAAAEVRVPAEAAAKFLDLLAGCAARDGEYRPSIRHTDDYPNIRITVKAGGKSAVFRSESQGETHVPWAVAEGGKERIVEGDGPGRAMQAIEPYIEGGRRKKLVDSVLAKSRGKSMYE